MAKRDEGWIVAAIVAILALLLFLRKNPDGSWGFYHGNEPLADQLSPSVVPQPLGPPGASPPNTPIPDPTPPPSTPPPPPFIAAANSAGPTAPRGPAAPPTHFGAPVPDRTIHEPPVDKPQTIILAPGVATAPAPFTGGKPAPPTAPGQPLPDRTIRDSQGSRPAPTTRSVPSTPPIWFPPAGSIVSGQSPNSAFTRSLENEGSITANRRGAPVVMRGDVPKAPTFDAPLNPGYSFLGLGVIAAAAGGAVGLPEAAGAASAAGATAPFAEAAPVAAGADGAAAGAARGLGLYGKALPYAAQGGATGAILDATAYALERVGLQRAAQTIESVVHGVNVATTPDPVSKVANAVQASKPYTQPAPSGPTFGQQSQVASQARGAAVDASLAALRAAVSPSPPSSPPHGVAQVSNVGAGPERLYGAKVAGGKVVA